MILATLDEAQRSGARLAEACEVAGISIRTVERWRREPDGDDRRLGPRRAPPNALSPLEQARVRAVMAEPRYACMAPNQLVPRLADEGHYLASESTFYRLRRRAELAAAPARPCRVARPKSVHEATGPNQVWSWDITYLPSTVRGRYFFLYLVIDVWSRRIVGWHVDDRESADVAAKMVVRICDDERIDGRGLVLHADNGGPMRGNAMVATLQWLGIVPSFSRPHVSDDNPYSEALFRTLKYTPLYPGLFPTIAGARTWVERFVAWYNAEHRHSGIRFVTPNERHYGHEDVVLARRRSVYEAARKRKPERWSAGSRNWTPVGRVVLNPKKTPAETAAA